MHIVIIGGGIAGMSVLTTIAKIAKKSLPNTRITLIDPKSFVEVRWASIRGMFDSKMNESIIAPYSKILAPYSSMVKHVIGVVDSINTNDQIVTLSNGDQIEKYEVCLIATGSTTTQDILTPQKSPNASDSEPESVAGRRTDLKSFGNTLLSSSNVLVVGGGPIGCELAGDIAGYNKSNGKQANITLVQSQLNLIPDFGIKASEMVKKKLEKLGIHVKLGVRAYQDEQDSNKWILRDSHSDETVNEISTDIVFLSTGVNPSISTTFFSNKIDNAIDEKGWLLPDDYGVIDGTNNRVFCMGDCVKGYPKSGVAALGNKNIMAENIINVLHFIQNGASINEIQGFKPLNKDHLDKEKAQGVVTTGPSSGVAIMPFGTTRVLLPLLKNKTMFVFKAKSDIGW